MRVDLREILEPSRTAVLVIECQEGIIGERSPLPDLVAAVREVRLLETLAALLARARAKGVRVCHCTVEPRPDGLGQPTHTPIGARIPAGGAGRPARASRVDIVPALGPEPGDVLASRDHGLTAFHETGLDVLLRSLGVRTLVVTGVSVNIAITGATIDAVNRGYTVVIPTDCVAGTPPSYARDALRYGLRNLAYLSSAEQICGLWSAAA